jgi:hypothetical protein
VLGIKKRLAVLPTRFRWIQRRNWRQGQAQFQPDSEPWPGIPWAGRRFLSGTTWLIWLVLVFIQSLDCLFFRDLSPTSRVCSVIQRQPVEPQPLLFSQ